MSLLGPLEGFAITLRQIFKKKVTTQYPKEKRTKPQRFHGRHVLNRYPDGMEKCIGCELCAGVCPARCIYVRGKENPPDAPVSPGERYGFIYEINMLRCIFCALCVEACPTEAITMSQLFEMSVTNRDDAIYTRDELLMDVEGNIPHPEPDSILIDKGELRLSDGWMRATSPSGRAAYEGVVAWTPTAGVGIRPPERGQGGSLQSPVSSLQEDGHPLPASRLPQEEEGEGEEGLPPSALRLQQDQEGLPPPASRLPQDEEGEEGLPPPASSLQQEGEGEEGHPLPASRFPQEEDGGSPGNGERVTGNDSEEDER